MATALRIAASTPIEAEYAILGSLVADNRRIDAVADILAQEDFADPFFGRVFGLIVSEYSQGRPANPVTLRPLLKSDPSFAEMGGDAFLSQLMLVETLVVPAVATAKQIAAAARKRRLIEGLTESAAIDGTAEEIIDAADQAIVTAAHSATSAIEMTGAACVDRLVKAYEQPKHGVKCTIIEPLDSLLGPLRRKQLVIMAGRPGMGKAQPLGALVLKKTGWSTMGDLQIGDELASVDGAGSVVTGIFPQGARQVYRVTLSDGRSTECCGEHLWKVRYRDWDSDRILSTDKISEMLGKARYRNRLSIDLFSGEFGSDEPLPLDPWLLGFLLGDGSICGGQVRFSTKDPEIVEAVSAKLPADLRARHCGAYDYKITGGARGGMANAIMDALRGLGIYDTRSHDKFIPPIYLASNRDARLELLRGLMDSDGWSETFGAVRFSTASDRLAHNVCELVRSIGGICSVRARSTTYTYKGETRSGRTSYTCRIRLAAPAEIFTLQRKIERVGRVKNTARLNISQVKPVGIREVQCISVSHPSRLYVTDNYTVTHNTACALSYALGAAQGGHGVLFISLEMGGEELAGRMSADLSFTGRTGVPLDDILADDPTQTTIRATVEAAERLRDMPLSIVDTGKMTLGRLNMIVRRHKRRMAAKGDTLEMVVIDYLQLLSTDDRGRSNYETVSEISRTLKAIAKDNDIAILALAQLSREVEKRQDKRPQLSDLRDSGQIEQDADAVLFLVRPEYYLRTDEPAKHDPKRIEWEQALAECENQIEFICAKRRNGRTGTAKGHFYARFQAVRA